MLKKLFSTLALTSLLVGGLSVSQANAEAPNVDLANVQDAEANFRVDLGQATQFVVPAGLTNVEVAREFQFAESFLVARQGQTLGFKFTVTQPNGSAIPAMGMGSGMSYSKNVYGSLMSSEGGQRVEANYETGSMVVPADATNYTGYLNTSMYIYAGASGQTLPAGTYTFSLELTSFAGIEVVPTDSEGLSVTSVKYRYSVPGTSFSVPESVIDFNVGGDLCLDTSKVAVGDNVSAGIVFDGVFDNNTDNSWRTQTGYKVYNDAGYRDSYSSSITITQFDLDWGVQVMLNKYIPNPEAYSTHELAFRFTNQDDEDVSSNCAPAKPAAPTLSVANGMVTATGNFAVGSSARYDSQCVVYDAAAPTVAVRTVSANPNFQVKINYSCNIMGLNSGTTYLIKFRDKFNKAFSEFSDASEILIPAAGYTVTSTYEGVAEAKKIVKVSSNVLPIENFSPRTSVVPDGKGGFYIWAAQQGACPPSCGDQKLRIRHATATALDSTFAGTGTLLFESITARNAFVGGMGYYGVAKDKWAAVVNGVNFDVSPPVGEGQVVFGSAASAATSSQTLTQTSVDSVCAAASAGYATRPGTNMQVSVIAAPTNDALLSITCYKAFTIQERDSLLPLTVLATMDSATGALTYVAKMATADSSFNNVTARFSVNPNASGSEAMLTAFVTTSLVTQVNNFPTPNVGTITDRIVLRFDSNLGLLSTTPGAWGSSGGTIASEPTLVTPQENTGKIFAVSNSASAVQVITFDGAAVGAVRSVDLSQSEIATPAISVLGGHAVPSNETVLPVAVTGINKDAAGWIDLSTGVLTTGEVLEYTTATGNGLAKFWLRGSDKNSYLVYSDSAAPDNLTVLKWMDLRYVAPVGAIPVVTSKDVKYSKNTPTAGAKVTLTGTDLDEVISAKIGENTAVLGTKTATTLQLTIPTASAAGTVDITLTTAGGDTVVDTFTYVGTGVAQTVTVGALASAVVVGQADLTLSATVEFSPVDAGTAGAITWSSETPTVCSIVANKARLLTAGTCTVKATAAASGVLLAGTDTESTTVSVVKKAQTITLTGPTKVVVDLDGFTVVSSATSRLSVKFTTTTPKVCTVSSVGRVVAIAVGTCKITSTQAGSSSWLSATKTLNITVAKTPSTPYVVYADPKKPIALSKTGTYVKTGDAQMAWNRSKGTLALKLSVVYIGPVKATMSFKVGSKTYTCTSKFGLLKKQKSSKLLTLTSPNLCAAKTEKTQLAALKKISTSTVVKVTVVRDMYFPTTYKKIRTQTRLIYAKLG